MSDLGKRKTLMVMDFLFGIIAVQILVSLVLFTKFVKQKHVTKLMHKGLACFITLCPV